MDPGYAALGLMLTGYLFPSIIAGLRRHNNSLMLFFTNLLFGWTGAVWVGCFLWSLSCNTRRRKTS